ncbi:MAG: group 1 truncated hemoglobin [Rhodoglobus sp.]
MTLFDRLGGEAMMAAAVEEFYSRMTSDAEVSDWFRGVDLTMLKEHQRAFLAVGFGGPERYSGRGMRNAHAGSRITHDAYTRALDHLTGALAHLGVEPSLVAEVARRVERLRPAIVDVR